MLWIAESTFFSRVQIVWSDIAAFPQPFWAHVVGMCKGPQTYPFNPFFINQQFKCMLTFMMISQRQACRCLQTAAGKELVPRLDQP